LVPQRLPNWKNKRNFATKQKHTVMTIVSARDFRANQGKYFSMVNSGEHVILKSREGSFRLVPVTASDSVADGTQKVAADLRAALQELKEVLAGKKQTNPIENLLNEL
jgi:antitoxin (DNA-binding transcriptional repressor) of toxin-antitoxin stability system